MSAPNGPEEVMHHCCWCDRCDRSTGEPLACARHARYLRPTLPPATNSAQADPMATPQPNVSRVQQF